MLADARIAGKVRVICTDPFHRGSGEWAKQGYHYLDTAMLGWDGDGAPCILPRQGGVFRIQPFRRADGVRPFECPCSCGRTFRMQEPALIALLAKTWDNGTKRAVLDIAR